MYKEKQQFITQILNILQIETYLVDPKIQLPSLFLGQNQKKIVSFFSYTKN